MTKVLKGKKCKPEYETTPTWTFQDIFINGKKIDDLCLDHINGLDRDQILDKHIVKTFGGGTEYFYNQQPKGNGFGCCNCKRWIENES